MAISDREYYASHGLHIDQEKMLEDYVNKKIIEVLTDLKSEIEEMDSREHECNFATPWCIDKDVVVEIIQERINALIKKEKGGKING